MLRCSDLRISALHTETIGSNPGRETGYWPEGCFQRCTVVRVERRMTFRVVPSLQRTPTENIISLEKIKL